MLGNKSIVELVSREQVIFSIYRSCLENNIPSGIFFQIKQAVNSVTSVDINKAIEGYLISCTADQDKC